MDELKPCPFCGHTALTLEFFRRVNVYSVICGECLTGGPTSAFQGGAISLWNTRAEVKA